MTPNVSLAEKKRRLSFKESGELAALPERIDLLEQERDAVYATLVDAATLRSAAAAIDARRRLTALETEITKLTARWEALETIAAEG